MATTTRSLWPPKIGVAAFPAPAKILREQGIALSGLTNGRLSGEVVKSSFPSVSSVTYEFYIGVSDKSYRHKLLSIEVGLLLDYPVTIFNHEAGTKTRVASEEAFEEEIRLILQSDVTQDLLGRLLVFAK